MLVRCFGDMYVNMFLCGVEGVRDTGKAGPLLGGVCDRVGSLIVVLCDECRAGSGERLGGVG